MNYDAHIDCFFLYLLKLNENIFENHTIIIIIVFKHAYNSLLFQNNDIYKSLQPLNIWLRIVEALCILQST